MRNKRARATPIGVARVVLCDRARRLRLAALHHLEITMRSVTWCPSMLIRTR